MTNMHGIKPQDIIGDSDSIIAIVYQKDSNHAKAVEIITHCIERKKKIFYPAAIIAETITSLTRKFERKDLVKIVVDELSESDVIRIIDTSEDIVRQSAQIFNLDSSKKDTFFDAIVVATAKTYQIDTIFSFDNYYKKLGLSLAKELI